MGRIWVFRRSVSLLAFGALIVLLCPLSVALRMGDPGLPTYFVGMFATAVFIGMSVVFTSSLRTRGVSPNVLDALLFALQRDPDPRVRAKAAKGLAELDVEQSSHHYEHNELDTILASTLRQDPDPRVRAEVAKGLADLELEQFSYYYEPNKLDDVLFENSL